MSVRRSSMVTLALLALLAGLLLRRMASSSPSTRYGICLATLVLMACCPLATFAFLDVGQETAGAVQAVITTESEVATAVNKASAVTTLNPQLTRSMDAGLAWHRVALASLQPFLLIGYLCGVFLLSIRFVCGYFGTLWMRSAVEELSPEWTTRVAQLAARLGVRTRTRVVVSLRAGEAIAVGWLRPVVLLPLGWLTSLPPEALEAVIAHELAHLRRLDLWTSLLQRAIETLLFYHPAVWWLSRRTTLEREMCCDALAVKATGQRLSYVKTLETLGSRAALTGPLLATTFLGESDMNLLARVRQVLGLRPQRETGRAWPAGLAALGLAVALFSIAALPDRQTALAQEERDAKADRREGDRRSPEADRGDRRSPEADAPRREGGERDRPRDAAPPRREGQPDRPRGDNPPPRREGDRPPFGDAPPPRRDGERGGPRPGFPPPMAERDRELIEVIRQLQREVAELRREVAQLRGGPRPAPRDGERPPRDGDRGPRPAFGAESPGGGFGFSSDPTPRPRDGEVRKEGPRDGEPRKAGPRDGEAKKDAPRDGEARKEGPRDGEVKKVAPREGEAKKDAPREGDVKKDAPSKGEAKKDAPSKGEAKNDAPREGEARRQPTERDRD